MIFPPHTAQKKSQSEHTQSLLVFRFYCSLLNSVCSTGDAAAVTTLYCHTSREIISVWNLSLLKRSYLVIKTSLRHYYLWQEVYVFSPGFFEVLEEQFKSCDDNEASESRRTWPWNTTMHLWIKSHDVFSWWTVSAPKAKLAAGHCFIFTVRAVLVS